MFAHAISLSFHPLSTYRLNLQMQHFHHQFQTDLPTRSDPRLLLGISLQDNLVPWNDPQAVCRICFALHVDPIFLASDAMCPFSSGAGLCPSCSLLYGTSLDCVTCIEHREHFQVLASAVCWHARATTKEAFAVVLEHLFSVSRVATGLILEATTAWVLPSNSTILFRAHARLLVGSIPGVNAVSRGVNLPRYLSFAQLTQTLDSDPQFGFRWNGFLQGNAPLKPSQKARSQNSKKDDVWDDVADVRTNECVANQQHEQWHSHSDSLIFREKRTLMIRLVLLLLLASSLLPRTGKLPGGLWFWALCFLASTEYNTSNNTPN
jgi:hypothetical protein